MKKDVVQMCSVVALVAAVAVTSCASILGADFDHGGADTSVSDASAGNAENANDDGAARTVTLADGAVVQIAADGGETMVMPSGDDGNDSGDAAAMRMPSGDDGGGVTIPPGDASTPPSCQRNVQAGDLMVTEMMLDVLVDAGAYDYGQWIELANVSACAVTLNDVSIQVPTSETDPNVVVVPDSLVLQPGDRFVASNSIQPSRNHELPGRVYSFSASNVLQDTDTIFVKQGTTNLLILDYMFTNCDTNEVPCNYHANHSVEFPPDCDAGVNDNTNYWVEADAGWPDSGGYFGTPNAPNDVKCPIVEK